ncbi:MAG: hypothetical protein ACYCWW_13775, partial [Deltaproteobacteria bacterium]
MRRFSQISRTFRAFPLALVLLVASSQGRAQGLGLDLSDKASSESPNPPPATQPPVAQPPPPAPVEAPAAESASTNPAERDVDLSDRVKSVQKKSFRMAHRLSISAEGYASLNDAFFQKWGGGAQLAFAFADPF